MAVFDEPLPVPVNEDQLKNNNDELTIVDIVMWMKNGGGGHMKGHLIWWETFARHTDLYQNIAKPLLSIRTVWSMDVERRAKDLKHEILCPKRNRLSPDQVVTLYGCQKISAISSRRGKKSLKRLCMKQSDKSVRGEHIIHIVPCTIL